MRLFVWLCCEYNLYRYQFIIFDSPIDCPFTDAKLSDRIYPNLFLLLNVIKTDVIHGFVNTYFQWLKSYFHSDQNGSSVQL